MSGIEKQPEGYDIKAVEGWIKENIEQLNPPFEWSRLEGGHSNLTYKLEDNRGQQAVIEDLHLVNCYQKLMIWSENGRLSRPSEIPLFRLRLH